MTPKRIYVKNFGAIPEADIDLTGIFLCSIVGKNGRGKSTLFTTAPVFALFGVTKRGRTKAGITIDKMLRAGTQDLIVIFEIEHQGSIFQVTRTYSSKGKGKSTLDFQKQVNGRWESLNGTTNAETQANIISLLRLDADTFVASSMILQGKADEFTSKPAGDRKNILIEILGLSIYDQLQTAANKKATALEVKLEADKMKLSDLEEKLQALPAIEADLQLTNNNITYVASDIRAKETELTDIQKVIKDLEATELEAKQIEKQIDVLIQEAADKQAEAAALENKITQAEEVLSNEDFILAQVDILNEYRQLIPSLQAKDDRIQQLKTDSQKLTRESNSLLNDKGNLASKIEALELDLSYRDELKQANDDYQQGLSDLTDLDQKAEEWQSYQDDILRAEKQLEQSGSYLNQLRTELKNHETKSTLLKTANCPISGEVNCVFLKDANEAKKQIPLLDSEIMTAEKERAVILDLIKGLAEQQEGLNYDKANHANLKKRVEQLRQKAELYSQLTGKEELLKNYKEQRESIVIRTTAIQNDIDKIKSEIITLQTETENLPILKAQIPTLDKYVAMKDKLPEARTTIQLSREAITKLQTDIDQKNEQYQQLLAEYTSLSKEFAGLLPDAREKSQDIETELKDLQTQLNTLFATKGTYQAKLDALAKDAEQKDRLSTELAPKAKELVRWQTLVKAFGKNGVPALIIENAIPELERISNDILSQMSNGAHSLRFETQRDLKSKDGVAETLDIIVSDWSGSRPYETYSGGEQLRIDLAIRFALAELLANRAGSKVEWIVADEIFGSQDSEHRNLVIEAIKAVASRFKKILVISHITETQTAFDQQIVLSEGGKVDVLFN